jgi:DNA-binding NtrC family response regulator
MQAELSVQELIDLYHAADRLLENSKNDAALSRLRACAKLVIAALAETAREQPGADVFLTGGTLSDELNRYEGELIRRAFDRANGKLTRAAKILGITHQGLRFIIEGRQKDRILGTPPVRKRRRSIFGTGRRRKRAKK